jgi:hypothetical protein
MENQLYLLTLFVVRIGYKGNSVTHVSKRFLKARENLKLNLNFKHEFIDFSKYF